MLENAIQARPYGNLAASPWWAGHAYSNNHTAVPHRRRFRTADRGSGAFALLGLTDRPCTGRRAGHAACDRTAGDRVRRPLERRRTGLPVASMAIAYAKRHR